jgi:organic radical activating enzyme
LKYLEGILYGTKTLFVRLAGCPFTCFYCDTKESLPLDSGKEYNIEEACQLIDSNLKSQTYKVNFTGGDPLIQHEAVAPPTLSHLVLILINLIMFYHFLI